MVGARNDRILDDQLGLARRGSSDDNEPANENANGHDNANGDGNAHGPTVDPSADPDPAEIRDDELPTNDQPPPNDEATRLDETSSAESVVPEAPSDGAGDGPPEPEPPPASAAVQPEPSAYAFTPEPAPQSPAPAAAGTIPPKPRDTREQDVVRRRMPTRADITDMRNVNGVARIKPASATYTRFALSTAKPLAGRTPYRVPRLNVE